MKIAMKVFTVAACGALMLAAAAPAAAQEVPVPRMFQSMQKGQWKAEVQDSASKSGKAMPTMIICTDNLMQHSSGDAKGAAAGCKRTLIRDTDKEAILESQCPERSSTVTMKKQDPKTVLVAVESTGKRGHQSMKIHYTHLGACAAGQPAMAFEKDSEQCRKMRASVASMEPERKREQMAKIDAMCR